MNKYRVSIAKLETRVYYFDIEAEDAGDAEDAAWEAWHEGEDLGKGECIHYDEWRQDTEVLNETI
jgi:hypothetical protein